MTITAIFCVGLFLHANSVKKPVAMHAFEGVVILDINFTLIGAQALRLGGEIFALLVDFIFAEFVYIHRLIFLIIGVTFYHVKVELRFGFGQLVSFL